MGKDVIIIFLLIVISPFLLIIVNFKIDKRFDKSVGSVFCDDKKIYEGRLYVVDKDLATEDLQSPMFDVSIRDFNNPFQTQKRTFCKDLRIEAKND